MDVPSESEQPVLSGSEPPALPVSGSLAVPEPPALPVSAPLAPEYAPLAPESEPPAAPGPPLTQEEEDAKNGLYDAGANTTIVCIGDLEGTSFEGLIHPEGANQESQTNVLTPTVSNLTELYDYLTISQDGTLMLQPNVILVYLGDVFGDGPDNIKLATTLLKLKKVNPTRVIIISGNRDVNKVRLPYELQPTAECMEALKGRVEAFVGGDGAAFNGFEFEFEFERNNPDHFDYMWKDDNLVSKQGLPSAEHKVNIASNRTCLGRVRYVVEISMTETCAWKFLVDEYLTKKKVDLNALNVKSIEHIADDVKSYIYAYLVQAMSGDKIDCGVPEFNGIFEKILMKGHLMACIETPDRGKFGLMHSLPPRMLIPTEPGRIYEEQFNKNSKEASGITDKQIKRSKKVELNIGIPLINNNVRTLLIERNTTDDKMLLFLRFVSGVTSGSCEAYGTNPFSGLNLPLSYQTFNKAGFELLAKTAGIQVQVGGKPEDLTSVPAVTHIDMKDFSRIKCSHKPQGYIGAKLKFGDQLYYCVDVSKIDEQKYEEKERFGCCFLVIRLSELAVNDDAFIGRIMMKKTQVPNGHKVFSDDSENKDSAFDNDGVLYVNYVKTDMTPSKSSEFIPKPPPGNFPHILNMTYLGKPYKFEFENGENYTKKPTLTYEKSPTEMMNTLGGSRTRTRTRTRKRRSRYLKKSARTTRKRRRISKKLAQKNNKRKNKKSKRSSTSRQ